MALGEITRAAAQNFRSDRYVTPLGFEGTQGLPQVFQGGIPGPRITAHWHRKGRCRGGFAVLSAQAAWLAGCASSGDC